LIRDNKGGRLEDGSGWRIAIPLADQKQNVKGNAMFVVRPVPKQALDKIEDWPK